MKFLASKKLSDNTSLRIVLIWMLITLIISMGLNITSKSIDYGMTPLQWEHTILGNPDEFVDPLGFNDLLLAVHTDLFGLILIFILIGSLMVRTVHSSITKMLFLGLSLSTLVIYPSTMLAIPWIGAPAVIIAVGSFIGFHLLMIVGSLHILFMLFGRKL